MATTTTSGFLAWFNEWGQVVIYLAQVLYWIGLVVAALVAAWQFKRLVSFKIGDGRVFAAAAEEESADYME